MKDIVNKVIANIHIFILLYGAYTFYFQYEQYAQQVTDIDAQFPPIREDIVKTQQKVKEIQDFVKKADEYKVRVEEVAKTIESVQKQLPAETNDSQILSFFQEEMKVLNIKDPNLTPGKEEKTQYFISRDYSVRANGTFLQFLIFLERIGNAARIYNVQSLKLVTNLSNQKGRFQVISGEVVIQAYRFNPDFRVDRGFDQINNQFPVKE